MVLVFLPGQAYPTVAERQAGGVCVETDRSWYLAGEAMKVSVTIERQQGGESAEIDAVIAYAELCDTHGLAAGVVVGLQEGTGRGTIELPMDLHSGYYLLSVYTRHDPHVTHRLVAVVNPLRKRADDDIEWVSITHPDSLSYPESTTVRSATSGDASLAKNHPPSTIHHPLGDVRRRFACEEPSTITLRETEGHIIEARVKNIYGGHAFKGSQISPSLSIVGKQIHYFEGRMVDDSTAVFNTFGLHGRQPLVLSAMTSTGTSLPIEMISPFAALVPRELPHLVFRYKRSEVEARSISMQRRQASERLRAGESAGMEEVVVPLDYDETLFGNHPDLTYNLDEYRQFLTVREVLLEYVKCVRVNRSNNVTQLTVRKTQDSYNSSWPSMVLIDGMPVADVERFLNYDARRVHFINIYGGQYTFGNGVYNGILSVVTRSGRLTNYPVERNMQYLVYGFPE